MNRDDIVRMAREAMPEIAREITDEELERFANLVAAAEREANLQQIEIIVEAAVAAEREACIKFLKSVDLSGLAVTPGLQMYTAELIEGFIEAIRARGEEPKRHPGYIMGEHWLQAAYTRICTGETEADVMADYGWQRESR
jgi:hypothetical protein